MTPPLPSLLLRGLLASPRFALAGHSMGDYMALEVMRQAADRTAVAPRAPTR